MQNEIERCNKEEVDTNDDFFLKNLEKLTSPFYN